MTIPVEYLVVAGVVVAFVLAAVAVRIGHAVIRRVLDALDIVSQENRAAVQVRAERLSRALTIFAYAVAAMASISLALARFGVNEPRWEPRVFLSWFLSHGINVIIILVGAYVLIHAANLVIEHLRHRLAPPKAQTDFEWQRRAATLSGILSNLVTVSVCFVALLMLLHELSIDVVPILTGAGIAGLAIGFGAQNLVRDVISGFFLILEDQVRIGDLARINHVQGIVEQINLRTIVLRDMEGAVQVFPNGTVTALANLSKQFAYAIVDMRVAYGEDINGVLETIKDAGTAMEQDEKWGPLLLAPIDVLGVDSFTDALIIVRARFKTLPLNQAVVASELRRRTIAAFAERGIRPFGVSKTGGAA